jgi:hypothetical protein
LAGQKPSGTQPVFAFVWSILVLSGTAVAGQDPPGQGDSKAVVRIHDPAESKTAAIPAPAPDFHHRIVIEIADAKAPAPLRVAASELTAPGVQSVQPRLSVAGLSGTEINIPSQAAGLVAVDVAATLSRLSEYTGWLSVSYGNAKPLIHAIRANRTLTDLPLEVLGVERASNESCWACYRSASVWLVLQAPPDRNLAVTPVLTALALVRADKEKRQASLGASAFNASGATVAGPVKIEPNKATRVELEVTGLADTGEYAGSVRLSAPGFKPKDQAFTVFVKDPWWLAAIFIAIGAGISVLVKRYGADKRPRLIVRQRVADLRTRIQTLRTGALRPDDAEQRVLDSLDRRLSTIAEDATRRDALPATWAADTDKLLERINDKLSVFVEWANARRRVGAVRPPEIVQPLWATLGDIEQALLADGDISAENRKSLSTIPDQVAQKLREAFIGRLDAFLHDVEEQKKVLDAVVGDPRWARVHEGIAAARQAAVAGQLDEAQTAFDAARLTYARLLADDLASRIGPAAPAPVGLPPAKWDEVRAEVKRLLDLSLAAQTADGALAAYVDAYRAYLGPLVRELFQRAADEQQSGALRKKVPDDKRPDFDKAVDETLIHARAADAFLAQGKLPDAFGRYLEAARRWQNANSMVARGLEMFVPTGAADGAPVPGPSIPGAVGESASGQFELPKAIPVEDADALRMRTKRIDSLLDWLALAVSVALGVLFVWAKSPTWGGLGDWLLALLWGLGTHQVSGFTFDGVLGLREKLIK